jgi:DNA-binding MarR family transcriptional regulator
LSEALDKAERAGWLQRTASTTDGRTKLIALSPSGEELLSKTVRLVSEAESRAMEGISVPDRAIALRVLRMINRNLAHLIANRGDDKSLENEVL